MLAHEWRSIRAMRRACVVSPSYVDRSDEPARGPPQREGAPSALTADASARESGGAGGQLGDGAMYPGVQAKIRPSQPALIMATTGETVT